MKKIISAIFLLMMAVNFTHAQSNQELYLNALDDWHDGHYPQALTAFNTIMNSSESGEFLDRIALQTGELFEVTELSDDGANIRFSDDGKFAIYEKNEEGKLFTVVHDVTGNKRVMKIHGKKLIVLKDGSVIFEQVDENDELKKAAEKRNVDVQKASETGDRSLWRQALNAYAFVEAKNTRLFHLDKAQTNQKDITPEEIIMGEKLISSDEKKLFFVGMKPGSEYSDIFEFDISKGEMKRLTDSQNFESNLHFADGGSKLVFNFNPRNTIASPAIVQAEITNKTGVFDLSASKLTILEGRLLDVFGSEVLLLQTKDNESKLLISGLSGEKELREIFSTDKPLADPILSPERKKVAFSLKEQDDFEVYTVNLEDGDLHRVSREIQHDRFPVFLTENKVAAAKGEGRHRRSFMYDLESGEEMKLFHNNSIRTIAPEYEWVSNSTGDKLLIVAERDGNTISPERGVYVLDFNKKISKETLLSRIEKNLNEELALREKGQKLFEQISDEVREVVSKASVNRVYTYENDLYKFDSKYISKPGNDKAAEYLYNTYKSFGYEPEYQWFTPAGRDVYGGKTANVIATLKGTTNPELVYVVSSHYDSVERGPGADDNTSGTAALLEAARILADNPQPATIIFASFTGEEAGLLGSREFVRQAQEKGMKIVGALNNDMVGMANDSRLDNTIRYSNPGIRDIQHASAFLFTDMVTYDALYYKFTDAHAYYEAYGDIVGGIGSYPVLGNPFYHQWNDNLETINHQLVTEVAKSTAATMMLLASSPSRIKNVAVENEGKNKFSVDWELSPEAGISEYIIHYQNTKGELKTVKAKKPGLSISDVAAGNTIQVKAVNSKGVDGWDWASVE
ncbi:MAG: M20/M25/M40 family metallo-hydrolase [Balneolaceae bacterium]